MTEWGLQTVGFKPKTSSAIKEEIEQEFKKSVDTHLRFTPDTIAGMLTGIIANQTRQVWEMAAGLYTSFDSNTASGRALDALCALTGTYRKQAAPSRAVILATLEAGATLPKGTIVADPNNAKAQFITQKEIKNDEAQTKAKEIEVVADENGPILVEAGKLTKIVTLQTGLLSVNNPKDAILGRHTERDEDLRLRRIEELSALGSSTHGAMSARLLKVKDVEAVHIEEGTHDFCAYVMGGDELDIAETIWQHKPLGIHTFGTISKAITASNGQIKTIKFSRPTVIELSLHLNLKVKQKFDTDELAKLQAAIAKFCKEKFNLGDVPYPSQIFPVLFAQDKLLDVLSIQLRLNNSVDAVPKIIKPHELIRIISNNIHIEQIHEFSR